MLPVHVNIVLLAVNNLFLCYIGLNSPPNTGSVHQEINEN